VIVEPFTINDAATAAAVLGTGPGGWRVPGRLCCLALVARPDRPTLTADAAWTRIGDIATFGVPIHLLR
jgi:hypothetical protein